MKSWRVLCVLLLAACGGASAPEVTGAPGSEDWLATAAPEDQAEYFAKACRVYGLKPGTPAFTSCVREEIDLRDARNRRSIERASEARSAELHKNRTTETRCSDFFGTRSCESY